MSDGPIRVILINYDTLISYKKNVTDCRNKIAGPNSHLVPKAQLTVGFKIITRDKLQEQKFTPQCQQNLVPTEPIIYNETEANHTHTPPSLLLGFIAYRADQIEATPLISASY